MKYQEDYKKSIKRLEEKVMENKKKYEDFCTTSTREVVIFVYRMLVITRKLLRTTELNINSFGRIKEQKNLTC